MFEFPLFNGPRTWKYALPGTLVVILLPVIGKMLASPDPETQYWAMVPIGFFFLFIVMFGVNLWKYISEHSQEMHSEHQAALSLTPLVMLAQAMQQMHPEAVRVLNRFGVRTGWEVRLNAETFEKDWVLAGTNAHFGFIEHVLSRSGKALYPKRSFAEGSKKWDPDGMVDDREQYDDLERWMFARTMVTRSHGNFKPAEFIPPWNPQFIMEAMGLSGEQDLYRPEEDVRKDLNDQAAQSSPPLSSSTKTSPQMGERNLGGNGNGKKSSEDAELSDAEWQAIQDAMAVNITSYEPDSNLKGVA